MGKNIGMPVEYNLIFRRFYANKYRYSYYYVRVPCSTERTYYGHEWEERAQKPKQRFTH